MGGTLHGTTLIIMAIVNIVFAIRGYRAVDQKGKKLNGRILLFLGLIELILSTSFAWLHPANTFNINLIVIVGGLPGSILTAIGGVIVSAGK